MKDKRNKKGIEKGINIEWEIIYKKWKNKIIFMNNIIIFCGVYLVKMVKYNKMFNW